MEITALRDGGVGAFVLSSDNLTGREISAAIIAAFPEIEAFVLANAKPFIAKFCKDGRVFEWKDFLDEDED